MRKRRNLSFDLGREVIQTGSFNGAVGFHSVFDNLDVSENTRKEYQYRISLFTDFIRRQGFHKDSFLDFKRHLQAKNYLGVSSKNKYLIVARIYCRELHRQGLFLDITSGIKSFQQTRKHKKDGFSDDDVTAITAYLHQLPSNQRNMRLKAILSLLVLQGLRQIEVVRLDVSDLDLVSGHALILGKGRDDKETVDLHPETVKVLREYLQISKVADGALFISHSNNSKNQRLTTKSIRNLINPILRELGIEKSVHGFRHYFATKLIKSYKGDLLGVTRYTRHRSLEMLQVYNDGIKARKDLPRFFKVFREVNF